MLRPTSLLVLLFTTVMIYVPADRFETLSCQLAVDEMADLIVVPDTFIILILYEVMLDAWLAKSGAMLWTARLPSELLF